MNLKVTDFYSLIKKYLMHYTASCEPGRNFNFFFAGACEGCYMDLSLIKWSAFRMVSSFLILIILNHVIA